MYDYVGDGWWEKAPFNLNEFRSLPIRVARLKMSTDS